MIDVYWALFLISSTLVIATPGQDMLLVMSRSITQGTRAGLLTAAGVSVGLVGHTVLATLGLGALLRASELAFTVLKLVSAAYLVYLGVQLLRVRSTNLVSNLEQEQSTLRLFLSGAASNIANPKIAIFYFAFLPQFVVPGARYPTFAILVLGLVFAVITFFVKGPVALFAGRLSSWLRQRPAVLTWLFRCSGLLLLALALRLAMSRRD